MGGKQPICETEVSVNYPLSKLFDDPGNPYGKSQDDKLNDLRNECKKFYKHYAESTGKLWEYLIQAVADIADLKKENDFLKQQITNGSSGKWGVYATKEEVSGTIDMLRQMIGLVKQDSDKLKSKFESAASGLVVVKPSVEAKNQLIKVEPPKNDLDGWRNLQDLTAHVSKQLESGKLKCSEEFGRMGKIGNLYLLLNIVKIRSSSKSGRILIPTGYGEHIGAVKLIVTSKGSSNCYYNIEKAESILQSATTATLDLINQHKKASEKYYSGEQA